MISVLSLSSCGSSKRIAYLQGGDSTNSSVGDSTALRMIDSMYDARIKPKDLLTVSINTFDYEVSVPFNLLYPSGYGNVRSSSSSENSMQRYLVDNDGYIDFPVLGNIKVGGKTKKEVEEEMKEQLKPFLKEIPVVIVRMVDYKISVLGEVARPNTYTISNEKVNILEALAMAGDMTIYGRRDNVKLIRETEKGERQIFTIDLRDSDIIHSPYFYLQQNDVVYVEPNKTRKRNSFYSGITGQILSGISVVVSVVSFIFALVK